MNVPRVQPQLPSIGQQVCMGVSERRPKHRHVAPARRTLPCGFAPAGRELSCNQRPNLVGL